MALYTWNQAGGLYSLKNMDGLDVKPTPSTASGDVFTRIDVSNQGGSLRLYVPAPSLSKDLVYTFFFNVLDGAYRPVLRYEIIGQSTALTVVTSKYDVVNNLTTIEVASKSASGPTTVYRLLFVGNPFAFPADGRSKIDTLANGATIQNLAIVCFLAGSEIRTPEGARLIETLRNGDEICVWNAEAQKEEIRVITWIGKGFVSVIPTRPDDEAGWPICVRQNAFSEGVPSKDLHITGEHCIFIRNIFVPARMLVNDATIYYDKRVGDYEFYHIETHGHSIIWANDLQTESYLDTGNRGGFMAHDGGTVMPLRPFDWTSDGAAPLVTDRAAIEPIYSALAKRAGVLGIEPEMAPCSLSDDPELCLETDTGQMILPSRIRGNQVIFSVPQGVNELLIHSRVSRPCDVVGPYIDDRRRLGVLIGKITLFDSLNVSEIICHLVGEPLLGWYDDGDEHKRWTMGTARLPLRRESPAEKAILALEVLACGPYLDRDAELLSDQSQKEVLEPHFMKFA
ncbi:hypothetical protein C0V97_07835 [Asaia sp. W19]|uniref:Hint domain-containing protein n=1 Tax=unclassified Asaia TaxID=2685023 RepID=UPI000F8DCA2D|nr:Hint domain-containing protein [Asaia sp. W19]RUT26135.1 hypothetical protein C0V97_07835 [Asaia sp. W19]